MSSKIFQFPRILVLFLLFTFANFLGLLITPALPEIARNLHLAESAGTWVMSIFLIGYTFGQLVYGPVANRFGRKPAISLGMLFALFGTVLLFFAQVFWVFCIGRFIQAIGAGVGLKIGFTIIGDVNSDGKSTKTLATLSTAFGVVPGIAVAIGGYITQNYGANACFIFLMVYTLFLWLICQSLPETAPTLHRDALHLKNIGHNYLTQLKDPYLALYAFLAGLATSLLYTFSTLSPYLSIERIGLNTERFGYFALIPSLGLFSGAMISRKTGGRYHPRITIVCGILILLFSSFALAISFALGHVSVWTLFLPAFFMYLGCNLIWSNALSKGLSGASDKANSSAVIQFINMGTATVTVLLVQTVSPTALMLLPATLGILVFLMFCSWFKLKAHH